MRKIGMIIGLVIGFWACEDEEGSSLSNTFVDPNQNDVEIRIDNQSNYRLDSIYLNTTGGEANYNSVGTNKKTDYNEFSKAYPIFHLRFFVDDKRFELIPVDYSGEEKVDFGRYDIQISVVDTVNNSFSYLLKAS